jgi:ComF family protein
MSVVSSIVGIFKRIPDFGFTDFVFPRKCYGCRGILKEGEELFCTECAGTFRKVEHPLCTVCGLPFKTHTGPDHICPGCSESPPAFEIVRSALVYEGAVRRAIHRFKYSGHLYLNKGLGDILADFAEDVYQREPWDCVAAVPLHPSKLRERGFNQALMLARRLAKRIPCRVLPDALVRERRTPPQTELSRKDRVGNVRGAFRAVGSNVAGSRVLLVDDVMTTGATMRECAKTLKRAGAERVVGVSLARSVEWHWRWE